MSPAPAVTVSIAIAFERGPDADALRQAVEEVPGWRVAWIAAGAAEAVSRCAADTPDILLLGLASPGLADVEATARIMAASPTTILIVTSSPGAAGRAASTDFGRVFDAMASGARDVVEAPRRGPDGRLAGAEPLRAKISLLARLASPQPSGAAPRPGSPSPARPLAPLVAVGASTGGPGAVASFLAALPRDLRAPVVVVQHVDDPFARGLAAWLEERAGRPVRLAASGDRPREGDILLAGTSAHLVVSEDASLVYTQEPRDCPYRPSVDAFLSTAALRWSARGVAVLLTGMGRDGAEGLLRCREAGWHTIAQDQKTSVLYGMPRAAREIGAAVEVLPLPEIAPAVVGAVRAVREALARRGPEGAT